MDIRKIKIATLIFNFVLALGIATTATSALAVGTGTHTASGTYTWDATTSVLTTNWTNSDFVCDGVSAGSTTNKTGVTITSTTMTANGGDTWTRSSGAAGSIVGAWTFTNSATGNSFALTFNADSTVSLTGVIVSCSGSGGAWAAMTPMPSAQAATVGGVINGNLYVVGGNIPGGGSTTAVEMYDPVANTWTTKAPALTSRAYAGGGVINGKLYVVGGCAMNSDCRIGTTNVLESYDPLTNSWTSLAAMPTARSSSATGVINGRLYVAGGVGPCPTCVALTVVESYDPVSNTWRTEPALPSGVAVVRGAVINGVLYVVGGYTWITSSVLNSVYAFDPLTNLWTAKATMPTSRQNHGVEAVNGILYAFGGGASTAITAAVEAYDPVTNLWTAKASMPTAKYGMGTGVINGKIYAAGGADSTNTILSTVDVYQPSGSGTGTHTASGTSTWDATTGVLTTNWTSSDFTCGGPSIGTDIQAGVIITATTMTMPSANITWTLSSGTAGNGTGIWTFTDSGTGNSYTLTVNTNGTVSTVSLTANIVNCGVYGGQNPSVNAQHWSNGYSVQFNYSDPNKTASLAIPTATITVDGNTTDWSGVSALATDPQGDASTAYTGDDIKALYVAKDANNLYIRMDLWDTANTNFGNGPSPNAGSYRVTINSNSSTFSNLGLGVAHGPSGAPTPCGSQWELGCNGSNGNAPTTLQGPSFVGVSGSVIEIKVPLADIGNPTVFYSVKAEVNDCCVHAPPTVLDEVAASPVSVTGPGITGSAALAYNGGNWSSWTSGNWVSLGTAYPAGLPYTYTFTITDATGTRTATSTVSCFQVPLVTNISPTGSVTGNPTFSWTGITDPSAVYGVQVNDSNGNWLWANYNIPGTSIAYNGPALTPGVTYGYAVSVQSSSTCSNGTSFVPASFTYGTGTGLTVPTGLTATAVSSSQVNLTWAASTSVGVTQYNVYQNGQPTPVATVGNGVVNLGNGLFGYNALGMSPSTTYSYTVSACDVAGNCSAQTAAVSATTSAAQVSDIQAPTVPAGLTATPASATQVDLSWTASTDNIGVTGYKVYRNGTLVGSPTATNYSDTGLTASTMYSYTVAACDAAANCSAQSVAGSATTSAATTSTGGTTLSFVPGWNLVGNSINAPMTVATTFGDMTKVQTVWKWIPATSRWAFYAPSLADGGSAYAAGKGYDFLTTINGGEGFWVNVKPGMNFTASLPAGTTVTTAGFQDQLTPPNPLPAGWSLIAVGDSPTPRAFNNGIGQTPPPAGAIPTNLTTLWAWNSAITSWYFYAPSLDAADTMASYITGKSYLNFGTKVLDPTMGFWVNRPASAGASSTTAVAISSIQTQLTAFQNLFATAKPAATNPALVALFDASLIFNGMNKAAFLTALVDPNQGLSVGDQFVGLAAATPLDAGAVANDATHQWFTFAIQSAGGYVSHDNGGGAWLAVKDATTGNWLIAGNRRYVGINVMASAEQQIPSAAQVATGSTTTYSSQVNLSLHTGTGGGGAAAVAAAGVTSALVTGPGIVSANGVTVYSSGQNNWVPPCGSQGPAGTITTDCMNVSQATAGSRYTFKIFTTAGGTTAPAYTYTEALYAAPVPVAGLTAANFPAITSVTPTTFASGATVTVNWTLPAGLKSDWIDINGWANVAPYGQLFQTGSNISGAALIKSLVVPAYTGTLGGAGIYLQARDVNGMTYATSKQY